MRRVFVTLLFVSLGLSALTGCGPKFNGSLTGRDGDGTGPKPDPGQPQVTSLSPSTAVAGAASFTLTVNGLNFAPTTTVLWDNNTSLTTTYVSSTVLKAQVPASLIAYPTTVMIIPSPLGTFNYGTQFTITPATLAGNNSFSVSKVPVQANDMVWDPTRQQFYVSIASVNSTNANTITTLNPATGVLGSSVSPVSEPNKLSISSDGSYLYAGLDSSSFVQRFTLPALQPDINFALGSGPYGPNHALDIKAQPTSSHSVAIARGSQSTESSGIAIYDDAIARSQTVPGYGSGGNSITSLVWNPNGQSLYGFTTDANSGIAIMSVTASGVQIQTQASATASLGNSLQLDSTTGYLYTNGGAVLDPVTGAVVARFPLNALQGGLNQTLTVMVPDGKLNIAYFLGATINGTGGGIYVLEAFDLTHLTLLGAVSIPNVSGIPTKMIRWGSNGLAFFTTDTTGVGSTGDGIYLVSGGFVTSPAP